MFQSFKGFQRSILSVFMGVFTAVLLSSMSSHAQNSPCDPDYYESLEARAWLEAQREITQNQNLIYKPDSVLEYTCYVGHLNILAQLADTNAFFSGTNRWGNTPPGNMQNSLQSLVGAAMQTYAVNFPGNLLGGRSSTAGTLSSTNVSPGAYSCNVMQDIWTEAKCKNFIDRDHDGFFTFEEYRTGSEKRALPTACTRIPVIWRNNLKQGLHSARNLGGPPLPWTFENTDTFYSAIFPTSVCGSAPGNHIATGLLVSQPLSTPPQYPENICIVPGCRWEPVAGGGGSCARP